MSVYSVTEPSNSLEPIKKDLIDEQLELASKALDRPEKRVHYEAAFKGFCARVENGALPANLESKFHLFLESFGDKTCYAQMGPTGPAEGFKKSARLMEFSFLRQMGEPIPFNWFEADNLESLIQKIDLFDSVKTYIETADPVALLERTKDKAVLLKTLKHLVYSYQNSGVDSLQQHLKLNALVELFIDQNTEQGQCDLADFRYNRCGFLISLEKLPEPESTIRQVAEYDKVLALFQKMKDSLVPEVKKTVKGKLSQIDNMKGLKLVSRGDIPAAELSFRKAFQVRKEMLEEYKEADDEYFLSNVRTGIIHCLCQPPLTVPKVTEANEHAQALGAYLAKQQASQNHHLYQLSYLKSIMQVNAAAEALKKM